MEIARAHWETTKLSRLYESFRMLWAKPFFYMTLTRSQSQKTIVLSVRRFEFASFCRHLEVYRWIALLFVFSRESSLVSIVFVITRQVCIVFRGKERIIFNYLFRTWFINTSEFYGIDGECIRIVKIEWFRKKCILILSIFLIFCVFLKAVMER